MATKAFDPQSSRELTKPFCMSAGFNDPTDWISTGNYAPNHSINV